MVEFEEKSNYSDKKSKRRFFDYLSEAKDESIKIQNTESSQVDSLLQNVCMSDYCVTHVTCSNRQTV